MEPGSLGGAFCLEGRHGHKETPVRHYENIFHCECYQSLHPWLYSEFDWTRPWFELEPLWAEIHWFGPSATALLRTIGWFNLWRWFTGYRRCLGLEDFLLDDWSEKNFILLVSFCFSESSCSGRVCFGG